MLRFRVLEPEAAGAFAGATRRACRHRKDRTSDAGCRRCCRRRCRNPQRFFLRRVSRQYPHCCSTATSATGDWICRWSDAACRCLRTTAALLHGTRRGLRRKHVLERKLLILATLTWLTRKHQALAAVALLGTLAYLGARARAAEPTTVPVVFSGYLNNPNDGAPLTGRHDVAFELWDDATATDSAFHVCSMAPMPTDLAVDGLFQLPLSTECQAAFASHPAVWYQITVDGTAFPRVPVGAVPFARWAAVAAVAESAQTVNFERPCGTTPPTTGLFQDNERGTVGLAAAKSLCETTCGSSSAHICLEEDLIRYEAMTGARTTLSGWVFGSDPNACRAFTCECKSLSPNLIGWTTSTYGSSQSRIDCATTDLCDTLDPTMTVSGQFYSPNNAQNLGVSGVSCSTTQPILCCDTRQQEL